MSRAAPVSFEGRHYQLPFDGGDHLGKALKSTIHPYRPSIPILLAAEGPKNVALAAEIGDGWLPLWFSPKSDGFYREALSEGFSRDAAHATSDDFEVACTVWLVEHDDVEVAASFLKPEIVADTSVSLSTGVIFRLCGASLVETILSLPSMSITHAEPTTSRTA